MNDTEIVALYLERNESAINETADKYGKYLTKIAFNILYDSGESEETVNDTYLAAWNSIPPHEPCVLSAFLSKITRRLSIDLLRRRSRVKRKPSEYALSLDELSECAAPNTPDDELDIKLLSESIGRFLEALPRDTRDAFICRYYFLDPLRDVARALGVSEAKLKSLMHRTRLALREHLTKEGFSV